MITMKTGILLCALFLLGAASTPTFAENYWIDGTLSGGSSLLDYSSESFDAKPVPTAGLSFTPVFLTRGKIFYAVELGFLYSFRSNYNNYYYYDSYLSLSLTPHIGIALKGRSLTWFLLGGVGGAHAFSGLFGKTYLISSAGAGVYFPRFLVDGIQISYVHSFVRDYRLFETIRISIIRHLFLSNTQQSTRERKHL
jgi:hypothetical protein